MNAQTSLMKYLDVLLLGEELAPGTSPDDVSGIGQDRGPVEA